ncbi:MAG: hypothetical protein ACR2OD_13160 [Gaiellaceae bacterium]
MAAALTLQERLDAHLEKSKASRAPEVNAALAATAEHLRSQGAVERALGVGATAPDFTLPNALGADVSLAGLLDNGPVVVAWYRGGW